jgi:hypothetical protein
MSTQLEQQQLEQQQLVISIHEVELVEMLLIFEDPRIFNDSNPLLSLWSFYTEDSPFGFDQDAWEQLECCPTAYQSTLCLAELIINDKNYQRKSIVLTLISGYYTSYTELKSKSDSAFGDIESTLYELKIAKKSLIKKEKNYKKTIKRLNKSMQEFDKLLDNRLSLYKARAEVGRL